VWSVPWNRLSSRQQDRYRSRLRQQAAVLNDNLRRRRAPFEVIRPVSEHVYLWYTEDSAALAEIERDAEARRQWGRWPLAEQLRRFALAAASMTDEAIPPESQAIMRAALTAMEDKDEHYAKRLFALASAARKNPDLVIAVLTDLVPETPGAATTDLAACKTFVLQELGAGARPTADLLQEWTARGGTKSTLRRACKVLGVSRQRVGGTSGYWRVELPAQA
jgi:hypothetical protein